MLTVYFGPASTQDVIAPSGELPVQFLIECSKEAKDFDCVESCLGIEVHGLELFKNIVHEGLNPSRIFIVEHVLGLLSAFVVDQPHCGHTSKNDVHMETISLFV